VKPYVAARIPERDLIFVTGAGGVVGQALLQRFPHRRFICLVHKKPVGGSNVSAVCGDVRQPLLGLSPDAYDNLARRISCIVHSAAITDFTMPKDEILAVNVDGTQRVLELAARAGVPVYHISTAFVHPREECDPTPYERSKTAAEGLVKESGLGATIVRPSVILGDSVTGEIANFQGFHFLVALFLKGLLPFVPTRPDSYIDFVPQDFVADAIGALVEQRRTGEEVWLTAGTRALRIDDIVDGCLTDIPREGAPLGRPNMISQDTYERLFKPVFFHALPKGQKKLMDRAMTMVKYLNTLEPLPCASPALVRSLKIPQMPDPRVTLRSTLSFLAQHYRMVPERARTWATG